MFTSALLVVIKLAFQTAGALSEIIFAIPIVANTSPIASCALPCSIPFMGASWSNLKTAFPLSLVGVFMQSG